MNNYRKINEDELLDFAIEYCEECIEYSKEHLTNSGKVGKVKDRKIPTIGYFCNHWIRRKDFDFYKRQHVYLVQQDESHPLYDTIKKIRKLFDDLAEDVVANEGKGIFWAKNRLGMTDKATIDTTQNVNVLNVDPLSD